jgi:hypothetical protein
MYMYMWSNKEMLVTKKKELFVKMYWEYNFYFNLISKSSFFYVGITNLFI